MAPPETPTLPPEEITRIRQRLGLSKLEAGDLIGGGPRAFSKYESGTIEPAAAVSNLLRVLDANPTVLDQLRGLPAPPIDIHSGRPGEVSGAHVRALTPKMLTLLMRRLLSADAQTNGLTQDGVHVAATINAPDDKEDARIEWVGGPDRTIFIPARRCIFQSKATDVSPSAAAADVLDSHHDVSSPIREILSAGGVYIVFCSRSYAQKAINARVTAIHRSLTHHGLTLGREQLQFRDADQIALWVNAHPSVAAWLLDRMQPGMRGPFHDWTHWGDRADNDALALEADERLQTLQTSLRAGAVVRRSVQRIIGPAGVGKSRLTFESFQPDTAEEGSSIALKDLILYVVLPEAGVEAVTHTVQNLVDSSRHAIVVVDRCSAKTHDVLAGLVKHARSHLSLITIDHEDEPNDVTDATILRLQSAPASVIEGILKQRLIKHGALAYEDNRRLQVLAAGLPRLAVLLADAWLRGDVLAGVSDEVLIDRIVSGHGRDSAGLLKDVSRRLSVFGQIGVKERVEGDLSKIAKLGKHIPPDDFRSALVELIDRGVVQRRGRFATLQPLPISLVLAEKQWQAWNSEQWDEILCGSLPTDLRIAAARRLTYLNSRPRPQSIAFEVTRHVCRHKGPLAGFEHLKDPVNAEILSLLAEIDSEAVIALMDRALAQRTTTELISVDGNARRAWVRALVKLAFVAETFERAARLLFRFALAENEKWNNNATGQFSALFPVMSGGTAAGPTQRLDVLDELLKTETEMHLIILVDALLEGGRTHSFSRTLGPESHGTRPALQPWQPKTNPEAWDYIKECLRRVSELAIRNTPSGEKARTELGHTFRNLVNSEQLTFIESLVSSVLPRVKYWPEALGSLGDVLQHDEGRLQEADLRRVRALIQQLQPQDLATRLAHLVTNMPWDYPEEEHLELDARRDRQLQAVSTLTSELLTERKTLRAALPDLVRGAHRMGFELGDEIARQSENPFEWQATLMETFEATPANQRNSIVLTGFLARLSRAHPTLVEDFKRMAVTSETFAPLLPDLCFATNIVLGDIALVCEGLRSGLIPVYRLRQWSFGGVFAKVPPAAAAPLFDYLFHDDGDSFSMGVDLIGMYSFQRAVVLDELRPQLRGMAAIDCDGEHLQRGRTDAHHFSEVMTWLLKHGSNDADAVDAARALATRFIADDDGYATELIRPLLPLLLSSFAGIVWPVIGTTIATDQNQAWRLEGALGDKYAHGDELKAPAILGLPEALLMNWCRQYPESAPRFVAGLMPLLAQDATTQILSIHPRTKQLLDEFGSREDVLDALHRQLYTFAWWGSRKSYFERYQTPFQSLLTHPTGSVRRWAQERIVELSHDIAAAQNEDDEDRDPDL